MRAESPFIFLVVPLLGYVVVKRFLLEKAPNILDYYWSGMCAHSPPDSRSFLSHTDRSEAHGWGHVISIREVIWSTCFFGRFFPSDGQWVH